MTPNDHDELIRLRDRIHAIADNTTIALGHLRDELHEVGTRVEVVAERLKAHTDAHQDNMKRLEHKIDEQGEAHQRQFDLQAADVRSVRRGLYTLAFSAISASLLLVMSLYALFGH